MKNSRKLILLLSICVSSLFTACDFEDFEFYFMQDMTKIIEEDTSAKVIFYAFDPDVNSTIKKEVTYPIGSVIYSNSFPTGTYDGLKAGYSISGWYFKEGSGTVKYNDSQYVDSYIVGTDGATFYGAWTPRNDTPYKVYYFFENPDDDEYSCNKDVYKWEKGVTDSVAAPTESMNIDGYTIAKHEGTPITSDGNGTLKIWYKRKVIYMELYSDDECYFSGSGKYGSRVPYKQLPEKNFYHIDSVTYVGLNGNTESGEMKTNGFIYFFQSKDRKYTVVWKKNDSDSGFSINFPDYSDVDLELYLSFDSLQQILTASCKEGYYTYTWFLDDGYVASYSMGVNEPAPNSTVILNAAQWTALDEGEHEIMVVVQDAITGNRYSGNITFRKTTSGYRE